MSLVALELDRQVRADRLVQEITARHGLPPAHIIARHSGTPDRFLVAFVPDVVGIAGTTHAVEYTFAATMLDSVEELRRVAAESPGAAGSAAYVHDLDGGME